MSSEITLSVGATAEPKTCGSCKFFNRNNDGISYRMNGICRIKMPAKIVEQYTVRSIIDEVRKKDSDYTGTEDWIKDTDTCDFQQSDGNIYIVQRKVGP